MIYDLPPFLLRPCDGSSGGLIDNMENLAASILGHLTLCIIEVEVLNLGGNNL